jgi:lysophospholipase L1-like esterase
MSGTSRKAWLRAALAMAVAVLVGATATFAYLGWQKTNGAAMPTAAPRSDQGKDSSIFGYTPTLLVVGDSFAGGTGDPNFQVFPALLAERMGWNLVVDAQGGTGYVNGRPDSDPPAFPAIDRIDADAANYRVDYMLIDTGRNDLGIDPHLVAPAADRYLTRARELFPNTVIMVMLPQYISNQAAENFPMLADTIRAAAERIGAYVIDPVEQGWYQNIDLAPLFWNDGIHLGAYGNRYYADRIIENFEQMGLQP